MNNDLFNKIDDKFIPLAEKMRPNSLKEYLGQKHLIGRGKPLKKLIESGNVTSLILWGPPGVGKTTLAKLIANYTKAYFLEFSAVNTGIQEIKKVINEAGDRLRFNKQKTILFLDEIHRFNKAQQDSFLPSVENGVIILIGATTENPSFEVNAPLVSRSKVIVLEKLSEKDVILLINRSLKFLPNTTIDDEAKKFLSKITNGDARSTINAIEMASKITKNISYNTIVDILQRNSVEYDKNGDNHYNVISAFIKSMRGSDSNASLYYLARMIKAGEDPIFIARRMVIFASEDIGNVQPTALVVATSCMQAVHLVGMPEAGIILAQTTTYLANSKKSRASYDGLQMALKDVNEQNLEPIPLHLRNGVTNLMKDLGYGKGYKWTDDPAFQKNLSFLPKNLKNRKYYKIDK